MDAADEKQIQQIKEEVDEIKIDVDGLKKDVKSLGTTQETLQKSQEAGFKEVADLIRDQNRQHQQETNFHVFLSYPRFLLLFIVLMLAVMGACFLVMKLLANNA
jgi:lipopolysaccharide export LptBFGC system permease protein LptF